MRGTTRLPMHFPSVPREAPTTHEHEEGEFVGRSCYVFNPKLLGSLDDTHCSHCRFYLTAQCPHIDEFLDDVEDLTPE